MTNLITKWHKATNEINQGDWTKVLGIDKIPFYEWQWLNALEESESVAQSTGWQPLHLSVWRGKSLIAIAPLYLKGHSYGEFIFDQVFLQLAIDLNLNYYPKLIGMSPFSPVEGYRFFCAPGENEEELTSLMLEIIDNFAISNGILSCNFLYVDPKWSSIAEKFGCGKWLNEQSLWSAKGANTFQDYMNNFNSNQRRNIQRERDHIKKNGIKVSAMTGTEINSKMMHLMYNFYSDHCARWGVWGSKYLTDIFFESLCQKDNKKKIVLFNAHRIDPEDPLAMSLCIKNNNMLWGRYWGSKEEIKNLHFETCYYSPIAWALENRINYFDPGAGGNHKRRRGFIAKQNVSLHRWYNRTMNNLIRSWLPQANKMMIDKIEATNNDLPFKIKQEPIRL